MSDRISVETAGRRLTVAPAVGARIVEFSLDGVDVLTSPAVNPTNFGSTFWTSPQSAWGWPPVEETDSAPYSVEHSADGVHFQGPMSVRLGLAVRKSLRVVGESVEVRYRMSNGSDEPKLAAPWEISRVRGGLSFFPTGDATYAYGPTPPVPTTEHDGITWFDHPSAGIDCDRKLFAHGRGGWLAHAEGGLLLLKRFPPIPATAQAPGEAQIELFANHDGAYVELEQQGAYVQIAPGDSVEFTVLWSLERLPLELPVHAGSAPLVRFVEALIARAG